MSAPYKAYKLVCGDSMTCTTCVSMRLSVAIKSAAFSKAISLWEDPSYATNILSYTAILFAPSISFRLYSYYLSYLLLKQYFTRLVMTCHTRSTDLIYFLINIKNHHENSFFITYLILINIKYIN